MSIKRILIWTSTAAAALVFSLIFLNSCGQQGSGVSRRTSEADTLSGPSSVGIYITGDASQFRDVLATIEKVDLVNTGTGAACEILTIPTTVNIADLDTVMQLLNLTECAAGRYDQIHLEVNKSVQLVSAGSTTAPEPALLCSFASSGDESNVLNPLECSGPLCSLRFKNEVIIAAGENRLAFDLGLRSDEVEHLGDASLCSAAVRVAPVSGDAMTELARVEAITGLVSDVSATDNTFMLVRGSATFTVNYSAIARDRQPGLDRLLRLAREDSLRVNVVTSRIGAMDGTIRADALFAKIEGVASNLATAASATALCSIRGSQTLTVDYSNAPGHASSPAEDTWVTARLYGHDSMNFLASRLSFQPNGSITDS
jgi:hypothetical protein